MSTPAPPTSLGSDLKREHAGIQSGTVDPVTTDTVTTDKTGGALAFSELKGGQNQDYQHEELPVGGRRRRQNSKKKSQHKKKHGGSKKHQNKSKKHQNKNKRQRGGK
jgi:hypothetical protein